MSDASPDALVYIAYARADLARVEPVVAALRERGLRVHFDAATIPGAGGYVRDSQRALQLASALVVFYSRAAAASPWVAEATRAFQSLMARGGTRVIIPVRLDDQYPLPSLAHYQWIEGSAAPAVVADALAQRLAWRPGDQDQAADVAGQTKGAASDESPSMAEPGDEWVSRGVGMWDAEAPYADEVAGQSGGDASDAVEDAPAIPVAPSPQSAPPVHAPPSPGVVPVAAAPAPQAEEPLAPGFIGPTTGQYRAVRGADGAAAQPARVEQVTFTAYHPRETQPQQWQPLIVYISLDDAATMALVAASAAERLAGKLGQFRPTRSEKATGLARGAKLRIVPSVPGFQFNPSSLDVTWQEDVQQHEFRMRAESAQPGRAANGFVQIFQGMVLRAEVPISIFVGQAVARLDSPDAYAHAIARAYRRIFASYSHQDTPVVESCETAAHTMGDQYLRDVTLLQAGQQWDPRLIQAINDADIFQLFWSKRAAASPFVEREWRHALMLLPVRPNFIRPVYWSRQLYPTPPELTSLHFQPLSLSSLGWGRLRTALYELSNR